jgi:hypothetical protein
MTHAEAREMGDSCSAENQPSCFFNCCQRCAQSFNFSLLLGIDKVAVRAEGLKGRDEPRRYRTARTPGIDRTSALIVQLSPSDTLNTMMAFDVAGIEEPRSKYCVHTTKG